MTVLCLQLNPDPSVELLRAINYHDVPERTTGDLPAPAKWSWPLMTAEYEVADRAVHSFLGTRVELTESDNKWLKGLDAFEFYLWCLDETAMGNRNAENCLEQITEYLDAKVDLPKEIKEIYDEYRATGWKRTCEQLPQ